MICAYIQSDTAVAVDYLMSNSSVFWVCVYAYVECVTSENCTRQVSQWVRSSHVSAYAFVYVVAVFTCAYALVKTSL